MAGSVTADRVVAAVEQLVTLDATDAQVQHALGLTDRELAGWRRSADAQTALRDVLRQRRFGTTSIIHEASTSDGEATPTSLVRIEVPIMASTDAERSRLAEWLTSESLL